MIISYFLWSLCKLLSLGCSTSLINLLIFLFFLSPPTPTCLFILLPGKLSWLYCKVLFLNLFLKNWVIIFLISRNSNLFSECTFLWLHFSCFIDYNIAPYFSEHSSYIFFEVFHALYINSVASLFRFLLLSRTFSLIFLN